MMIRPIDDGHGHRRPAQRVGREEAGEAAADNYDSVWSLSRHESTSLSLEQRPSPAPGRSRRRRFVFVETLATGSPELALVDVVLFEVTGVGLALLIACGSDVEDSVEPGDVHQLQRALRCACGDAPGLIDRLGVRDAVHDEAQGGLEKRNQE